MFDDANEVEMLCYQMKLADYPRSLNRARINDLMNGVPPYSEQEADENNIEVNVNYLEGTRIAHDARSQFYSAFLKPGNYFKLSSDWGPVHKRQKRNMVVTREINKIMKRSLRYLECHRSKFALDVLHGIAPSGWENEDGWCPDPFGVEDVMVPAKTLLTLKNLPFFAIYRSWTGPELIKLTRNREKAQRAGWNMALVDACIRWIDTETYQLMGSNWPEVWSPEKAAERVKGDGGFYMGDQVPTIDVWDLYYWDDDQNTSGWKRRMILDSWSTPSSAGTVYTMQRRTGDIYSKEAQFLYSSKSRKVATDRSHIITWQFADLSSVAPFQYHSVRSLGFLLYSICHLQNRLRCKFNEAVFEALLMYFRVSSADDVQRALKLELANRGFIDESLKIVPAAERYQVPAALVELGLNDNANLIGMNSSSYTAAREQPSDKREKTAFQYMAEMQTMTSLVSAGLMQAYAYQTFEYREIFRRFCKKHSDDPDVIAFRAACLRQDVPDYMIVPEAWEIEPERVMGSGNRSLELAIAQQLMQYRNLYDPEPQRAILRDFTMTVTEDPARATQLVPEEQNKATDAAHDAQLAAGSLMLGLPVMPKKGINHIDYVEALLADMALIIRKAQQRGNMATPAEVEGLQNVAQHIAQHIQIIAQDPEEKDRVKSYGDTLGKLMNIVKGFAQRLAEQQKKMAQQNGNGVDPKAMAQIKGKMMQDAVKTKNMRDSHAQRTAQRQVQFELEERRKDAQTAAEIRRENARTAQELAANRLKSLNENNDAGRSD